MKSRAGITQASVYTVLKRETGKQQNQYGISRMKSLKQSMNGFREGPDNRPFFFLAGKTPRADEIVEEDQY
ncbi:hypothetical protein ASG66_14425 [Bacillus sp. Leaf406]|nr:hypothetical protein ASG66_14425 [Bacillus sp. Leaf406]